MSGLFARIARRRTGAEAPGPRRPKVSGLRQAYDRMPHRRLAAKPAASAEPAAHTAGGAARPAPEAPAPVAGGRARGLKPPLRQRARRAYDLMPHRRVAAGATAAAPAAQPAGVAAPGVPPADGDMPTRPLPIGDAPPDAPKPALRSRGRLRRRLRYLRRLRELQRRDLGGLVFELHRLGRRRDDLVTTKIGRLDATERELRALEGWLRAGQQLEEVREPGIGGTCPSCGELHGSSDRFCATCGIPLIVVVKPPRTT